MTTRLIVLFATGAAALTACSSGAGPATATPQTAPAPSASSSAPAVAAMPSGAPAANDARAVALGDSIFHAAGCTACHGRNAKGSPHGPDLTSGQWAQTDGSYGEIAKLITTGVTEDKITNPNFPEPMPPRGGTRPPLSDDQIRALASYIYSLSHR